MNSGKKFILSEDWPVCLYDLKTAIPGRSMPGFLMSDYLFRVSAPYVDAHFDYSY